MVPAIISNKTFIFHFFALIQNEFCEESRPMVIWKKMPKDIYCGP